MPTKLRNNIKKNVREHHRKVRKEARKLAALGIHKNKKEKELHVPNLYPYKKKLIEHLQNSKKTVEKEKILKKMIERNQYTVNMEVVKDNAQERETNYLNKTDVKSSIGWC